ncbi:guanosine monophosphate reductase [Curtobacterium sp. Csp1]|uniref:IMP dehydrogenase n=1 Tax=Curtobacterium sp. Csp1 TaxID=2495429 RepID=UPI001597E0FB|nr:IMP dehydrogenase [Curtobacterium sp. Csp1]QKS21775.1 guanosine monophosphate reductase [Curtobacterium sp. Csp1]
MTEVEIGAGKRGHRAYAFDDIAVVPSRRTRDPHDVSVQWSIDAFTFASPILSAPMDSVSSPATVIQMGKLGILGVLDLEGLWTRYEDPTPFYEEIKTLTDGNVTRRMQEIYSEPVKAELITARLAEIRAAGVPVAGSLSPQRTQEFSQTVVDAGVDLFVIRGTTVSAEHVSLVGGASTYTSALHLMRTGAAGVLVGFGGGAASTTRAALGIHAPMATAVADVAGARRDYMDESGGRYVHVIADGGLDTAGDIATEAPGGGFHWGAEAHHPELPRGRRVEVGQIAPLENVLNGPTPSWDGRANLVGALRRSMATTGYSDVKEFQRVEVVVAPYHRQ